MVTDDTRFWTAYSFNPLYFGRNGDAKNCLVGWGSRIPIRSLLGVFKISHQTFITYCGFLYIHIQGNTSCPSTDDYTFRDSSVFRYQVDPYTSAIFAFSLNSAAYISEIIRAGILAVDKGQQEAAAALGSSFNE